jgi:hypothetical protein
MLLDLKHTLAQIVAWRLRRKCAQLAIALELFGIPAPAFADTIRCCADVRFSRTSLDDDVRSLLRANRLTGIFRPGVEGPISLRFDKVRAGQAFKHLMTERGLEGVAFDSATNAAQTPVCKAEVRICPS